MSEFRADIAGSGESTWATNALTFPTREDAEDYANDLLGRWMGADMARVVPTSTPKGEPIDPADENIVVNYRKG